MSEIKQINPESQKAWRKWLEENHSKEEKVQLIHNKRHTGKRAMSSQEAMDEAICFGWIDTILKGLDENSYIQTFVRRKEKGNWSKNTIKHGKRLIEAGKMSPVGLKAYERGLKRKLLDEDIPDNIEAPVNLIKAFEKNKKAKEFFDKVIPSHKKMWFKWLYRAKREETKEKRIAEIVRLCSEGKKF